MAIDVDYPRALLAVLAVAVAVALVWATSTSGAAFGAFNPAWDGGSDLRSLAGDAGADARVAGNTTDYGRAPAEGTVAVVLSPGESYDPAEAARLRRFVAAGGTLVVAEDFGPHANPLLAAVGADARVDGRLLVDEQHFYRAPELPVAGGVGSHPYVAGVESVTLNHGTAVDPAGATVLVNSSDVAYLDADGNGALDDAESVGPYPVATVEPVGEGSVVVLGDPSALINVMLGRPGNRAFVRNLFAAHERVLIDASHAGALPPLAVGVIAVRESPVLFALVGLGAIAVVGLLARRPGIVRRLSRRDGLERAGGSAGGPSVASDPALADRLAAHHPEWDDERVDRVVAAVRNRDPTDEPADER